MDLITPLPTTKDGHDAVLVFVDRLSKMTHFAATTTRFTSRFCKEVTRLLGTHCYMSTAFHPQTDGQTERMNRLLQETLRHYIGPTALMTIGKHTCRLLNSR
jgi:hypothetical protein